MDLSRVDPKWHESMRRFVEEGEENQEFMDELDCNPDMKHILETVLQEHVRSLQNLVRQIKNKNYY